MMETNQGRSVPVTKMMVWQAYKKVRSNQGSAGIDEVTMDEFDNEKSDRLYTIWNRLSSGSYYPPSVRLVQIPKDNGKLRNLAIPTVGDRVAQMVVKQYLEPRYEQVFSAHSYGYRPERSAHQALDQCVKNCWGYAWLIDLDIEGFFDNLQHAKLMEMLEEHTHEKWVKMYVKRWLEATVEVRGGKSQRSKGTPQGGVISPLLANIYLHYAFDKWMDQHHSAVAYERYADDMVIHCKSKEQAEQMLETVKERLAAFGLKVNEEKTKIVYCKQKGREEDYDEVTFTFVGYQFKPRKSKNKKTGEICTGYGAGISTKARARIMQTVKAFEIDRRTRHTIEDLSKLLSAHLRGWINYYSRYNKWDMGVLFRNVNYRLVRWYMHKYKVTSKWKAIFRIRAGQEKLPDLFPHWRAGFKI